MFNPFAKPANIYKNLIGAASSYMMVTTFEGKPVPDISDSYYTGNFGIALWSCEGESGFVVLQSVAGVWVPLGSGAGMCDIAILCHQFSLPYKNAEGICQQLTGVHNSYPHSYRQQFGDLSLNQGL